MCACVRVRMLSVCMRLYLFLSDSLSVCVYINCTTGEESEGNKNGLDLSNDLTHQCLAPPNNLLLLSAYQTNDLKPSFPVSQKTRSFSYDRHKFLAQVKKPPSSRTTR